MRVLFVFSGNSVSGQNKIVESQAGSLIFAGADIVLFPLKGKGFRGYFRNIKKLSYYLREQNFEIIHAHYGLSGMISLICRKREKLIVSFMGDDLVGSNNKNGTLKIWSRLLVKINVLLARYFYDYTIVKSVEMGNKLLKNTPFSLIPNGVNTEKFYSIEQSEARKQTGVSPDNKILLFVSDPGREEKNFSLSEKAVEKLARKEAILRPVSNLSTEILNLNYNAADLLLLTSYHEGSPNVVKEAMACGCPVVSTDVGDVKWLFGETKGNYLTTFDAADVAEKIGLAIEFRSQFGYTDGRKRIEQMELSSAKISEKIRNVYQLLIA
jgi:teichuronic acid biosynthesis glycosyltransferase TuaC